MHAEERAAAGDHSGVAWRALLLRKVGPLTAALPAWGRRLAGAAPLLRCARRRVQLARLERLLDLMTYRRDQKTPDIALTPFLPFTEDMLESYVSVKREAEVEPTKLRPNPYEFYLYYDC